MKTWQVWNVSEAGPDPEQSEGSFGDLEVAGALGLGHGVRALASVADAVARPFRNENDSTWSEELGTYRGKNVVGSDRYMEKWRNRYSPEAQQREANLQAEKDATDSEWGKALVTAKHLALHPSMLANRAVESSVEMIAGSAIPGAPMAKLARMAGAGANGVRAAAVTGGAIGEGIMSGAHNAFDTINENVREGRPRYTGVGANQLVTAGGVAATSLLGAKIGGSWEAALFNKEAREALQTGWKGVARGAAVEGVEEAAQAPWETIPQNVALDKPWYKGLGENVVEGGMTGAAMGGGMHGGLVLGRHKKSLLADAPVAQDKPAQAQAIQRPEAAQAIQPQAPVEEEAPVAPAAPVRPQAPVEQAPVQAPVAPQAPVAQPTPDIVREAVKQTPMAGTQPVAPAPAPQPAKSTKDIVKEQSDARKEYVKRYGLHPAVGVDPKEVEADSAWRAQNPDLVDRLGIYAKLNQVMGTGFTPEGLRAEVERTKGMTDEEVANALEASANDPHARTAASITGLTIADALRNPTGDFKKFYAIRKSDGLRAEYRRNYQGEVPKGDKPIPMSEIEEDKSWRVVHARDLPLMNKLVQANVASGAHKRPSDLRNLIDNHRGESDEEFAKVCADLSNASKNAAEADFYAAVVDTLAHPDGDLSQFIQKRHQAALDAKAQETKAREEAAVAETAPKEKKPKKATKAKAEKKEPEAKVLRVPTPDEWEKMTEYQRKQAIDEAEKSGDTNLYVSLVALDKQFKGYQAKQAEEAKKKPKAKTEEGPKAEEKPAETKKDEVPAEEPVYEGKTVWAVGPRIGDVSVIDGREAVWIDNTFGFLRNEDIGKKRRVVRMWKKYVDLGRDQWYSPWDEKPRPRTSLWIKSLIDTQEDHLSWIKGIAPYLDSLKGITFGRDDGIYAYNYVDYEGYGATAQTKLQEKVKKKAKVKHLADLEAVEAVVRKYRYPDFSFDLDWLREKAGKKPGEALKEAGGLKEGSETDPACEYTLAKLKELRAEYQEVLQKEKEAGQAPEAESKPEEKPAAKTKKAVKKATPEVEEKPVEAPVEEAPKEEAKPVSKYDELMSRPENERRQAFVDAAKNQKLVDALKEAGLLDGRVKSIAFRTINSPEFKEKVAKLTDTKYVDALQELTAMGKLIDKDYHLELPTDEQIDSNAYEAEKDADQKKQAATRTLNKKASAAARQVQEIGTEKPTTTNGRRDALILHAYFDKHPEAAKAEAKEVSDLKGMKKNAIIQQAVRGAFRPERLAKREEYLMLAKKEGLDAKVDFALEKHMTTLEDAEAPVDETKELIKEATTDSQVGEPVGEDTHNEDNLQIINSAYRSHVELPTGEAAGSAAVKALSEAYKNADLSEVDPHNAAQVIATYTKIEQEVVSKLPKTLQVVIKDVNTGKSTYELNVDGIQQAAMDYFVFAGEWYQDAPDRVKAWFAKESPFMKWLGPQFAKLEAGLAYTDAAAALSFGSDEAIRKGDLAAKAMAYMTAIANKGRCGWFRLMGLDAIRSEIAGNPLTAQGDKLLSKGDYWRDWSSEGISLPLRDVAALEGPIYPHLSGIFEHTPAQVISQGVQRVLDAGLPIPNANIVDLSRQVFPSKNGLRIGGLKAQSYGGMTYEAKGQATAIKGGGKTKESRVVIAVLTPREAFDNSFIGKTSKVVCARMVPHEILHAIDITAKSNKMPSAALRDALNKSSQTRLLQNMSLLLKRYEGNLSEIAKVAPVMASLLRMIPADKHHLLAFDFAYPESAAQFHRDEFMKAHAKEKDAEALADKVYQDILGMEMLASFGSAMIDQLGTREVLEKFFPEVAGIVDAHLAGLKNYKLANQGNSPYVHIGAVESGNLSREYRREVAGAAVQEGGEGSRQHSEGGAGADGSGGEQSVEDKRTARVEEFINQTLKHGEVTAKLEGIDPKLYGDPEWQRLAKEYAEADYAVKQATGSVNGYKSAIARDDGKGNHPGDTPENHQKLQDAMKRREAAELELSKKRIAFNDFEESHRQKVEPPKGEVVEQAGVQFGYNKVAEAVAKHTKSPWLREVVNEVGDWAYHRGMGLMFTRDLVDSVKDKLQSVVTWAKTNDMIDKVSREHQDKAVKIGQDFRNLSQKEQDAVNLCLENSVLDGQWYDVPTDKRGSELLDDIEVTTDKTYDSLSNAAKQVYRDVLAMGIETRRLIRQYTLEDIARRYAKRIENAKDEEKAAELRKEARSAADLVMKRLGDDTKPYVPLRRFGKYVVVLKSQEYADAVALYHALKDAANSKGATVRDRREAEKARLNVLSMQSNGKDYVVEYAETADNAMTRASELERGSTGKASYFERAEFMKSEQLNIQQMLNWVDRAERQASGVDDDFSGQSQAIKDKLNDLATTMYIQALSDSSALKSRLHRRKVAGASHDMMRAFMATASSESRYLGYLRHGGDLREALSRMEDEVNTSTQRAAAQAVFNEVRRRIELDLTPQGTAASGILRTTSVMMLLTNPAFFLQNLSQPLLYSASYMAGRHGLYRPLSLTAKQMATVAKWLKSDGTLSDLDKLVEAKEITADERDMLITMRENGLLDIGLSQEFGEFNRDTLSPIMGKLAGVTDMLASAARKVEVINRASSALVAYRLEKARLLAKGVGNADAQAQATKFADHVLYETHGDYSSRNAPRYFKANDFARVVTQFRKFQLIQLGLFTRMLKQALDKAPSEERHFARVGLAYTLGSFLAVTGVRGLPLYGVMALALGLAGGPGDDDEDVMRKALASAGVDKSVTELIVRGLPAMLGVDLSDKLGAGSVLSPFPYLEGNKMLMKNGPDDALEVLAQVLGPAASLLVRGARGASYGWQGDYTKAAENLVPSGFANLIKAVRFGTDGITTKAGDVVIPGEEFTFGDLIMQGVGLPTTKVTNRNLLTSSLYRHEEAFNQRAKEIRYSFTQAVKNHDVKARLAAIREWSKMNEDRRKAGFAPNKLTNLTSSAKQQMKRERGAIGGVETNKSNRGFVKQASELYS